MLRAAFVREKEKAQYSRTETLNDKSLIYWNDEDLIAVACCCMHAAAVELEIVYDILMQ